MLSKLSKLRGREEGLTVAEMVVATSIMAVVTAALVGLLVVAVRTLANNRAKVIASNLANQEIERIRSRKFGDIALGETEEDREVRGIQFRLKTIVSWVDDPFDDPPAPEEDSIPKDYKKVTVKVSWNGSSGNPVVVSTDVRPKGLDFGTAIYVAVIDIYGEGLDNVRVQISGPTQVNEVIDKEGVFEVSPGNYTVSASKGGYVDKDFGPKRVLVREGQTSYVSFTLYRPARVTVNARLLDQDGDVVTSLEREVDFVLLLDGKNETGRNYDEWFLFRRNNRGERTKTLDVYPQRYKLSYKPGPDGYAGRHGLWGFSYPLDPETGTWIEFEVDQGERKTINLDFPAWSGENTFEIKFTPAPRSLARPASIFDKSAYEELEVPYIVSADPPEETGGLLKVLLSGVSTSEVNEANEEAKILLENLPSGKYQVGHTEYGVFKRVGGTLYSFYEHEEEGDGQLFCDRYIVKDGTKEWTNCQAPYTLPYTTSNSTTLVIKIISRRIEEGGQPPGPGPGPPREPPLPS